MFILVYSFFDIALLFKPTLNAWKNLFATVAIVGLRLSVLCQLTQTGIRQMEKPCLILHWLYFEYKRPATPLKSLSHSSHLS